jgi:hypothetical protein
VYEIGWRQAREGEQAFNFALGGPDEARQEARNQPDRALNAGRNGGCPVLVIAITPTCVSDWSPSE